MTDEILEFCKKKRDEAITDMDNTDRYDDYGCYRYYNGVRDAYQELLKFIEEK